MKKFILILIYLLFSYTVYAAEINNLGKIAVVVPINGNFARYGELQMKGYELARIHLAKEGKIFDIRYFDTGSIIGSTEKYLEENVLFWNPDIIIGPYSSGFALDIVNYFSQKSISTPLIIPTATLNRLSQNPNLNIFRVAAPSAMLAKTVVDFIQENNKQWETKHLVILSEKSIFAQGSIDALEMNLKNTSLPSADIIYYEVSQLITIMKELEKKENLVVIFISRSTKDCIKVTEKLQDDTKLIGFLAGFLTPIYRQYAIDSGKKVYTLTPWRNDIVTDLITRFIEEFLNMYRNGFSNAHPQYHNVQAYSSLLIAGESLYKKYNKKTSIEHILLNNTFRTPLGNIKFSNFDGFYKQSEIGGVIQHIHGKSIRTVYSSKIISGKQESKEEQVSRKISSTSMKKRSIFQFILGNQFIALFLIIVLGLLFGKIKLWGISFGSSGVIFVALLFGHFHLTIPSGIGTLGLVLFIYCIGISAGPSFFSAFAKQGTTLAKLSIVVGFFAIIGTIVLSKLFDVPVDLAVGIFAGSLTSTPALASAIDSLKEFGPLVSVGYGIAYPFGVIGIVLFVQILPRILKIDLRRIEHETEMEHRKNGKIVRTMIEVQNPAIFGKKIADSDFISRSHCQISRVFLDGALYPIDPEVTFQKDQMLLMVCEENDVEMMVEHFGKLVDGNFEKKFANEAIDVVVTSKDAVEKSLKSMQLLRTFGITVTQITRNDVTFVPTQDTRLEYLDQLIIVGAPDDLKKFGEFVGHSTKALHETDLFALSVGLICGVLLGLLPISIGGSKSISLGLAGGPLLVALVLGHFGRIGKIQGRIPYASRAFMMELGLVFFLANAGIKAGSSFLQTISQYGISLFLVGAVISLIPLIFGYIFSTYIIRLNILETLGGLCGGMTSTPALGAIKSQTDSQVPMISYATAYPVALIVMIIAAQMIIALLP